MNPMPRRWHVGNVLMVLLLAGLAVALLRWQPVALDAPHAPPARTAAALGIALLFFVWTAWVWRRARLQHVHVLPVRADEWLVVHASQTGTAEDHAQATAAALRAAGQPAQLCSVAQLDEAALRGCTRALFVVSTTGEGDAPDAAFAFESDVMSRSLPLHGLRYGLLALGDRDYADFCAFGRALDAWLRAQHAQPWFARIEVDDGDPAALSQWQAHLGALAGAEVQRRDTAPFTAWQLTQRRVLNTGSPGAPAVWLRLVPQGALPDWQAGDIAEIRIGDNGATRDYSIASLPADGAIELLVRQQRDARGALGLGSGWLTQTLAMGAPLQLRVRRNPGFHALPGEHAAILIGNGTGIAGLRAHLKARAARGERGAWLLFGERSAAHDRHFGAELDAWLHDGTLVRVDAAYSRDGTGARYVQDLIAPLAEPLRTAVDAGAAIYVCGSLRGMAPAVDAALAQALGDPRMARLRREPRYRRDVY